MPDLTHVTQITMKDAVLRATCKTEDGTVVAETELPALITFAAEANRPRLPNMIGVRKAIETSITSWTASDLGLTPEEVGLLGSPTQMLNVFTASTGRKGEILQGTPDELAAGLLAKLHIKPHQGDKRCEDRGEAMTGKNGEAIWVYASHRDGNDRSDRLRTGGQGSGPGRDGPIARRDLPVGTQGREAPRATRARGSVCDPRGRRPAPGRILLGRLRAGPGRSRRPEPSADPSLRCGQPERLPRGARRGEARDRLERTLRRSQIRGEEPGADCPGLRRPTHGEHRLPGPQAADRDRHRRRLPAVNPLRTSPPGSSRRRRRSPKGSGAHERSSEAHRIRRVTAASRRPTSSSRADMASVRRRTGPSSRTWRAPCMAR